MSIMRTITFPGDTEPREIQDNRIEFLTLTEDEKVTVTPEEIFMMANEGKLIYLQAGELLFLFNPFSFRWGTPIFSVVSAPINIGALLESKTDIPVMMDFSIEVNEDKTITEISNTESVERAMRFLLPQTRDIQTEQMLTTTDLYGLNIPSWKPIPIAQEASLGMVKAISATPEMTEYIGIDANGQLRVAPSNNIKTDETLSLPGYAADAQVVGNKLSSIPISIAEDGYTEINGLRQAVQIDIAKTDTQISVITTLESGDGEVIQNSSIIALNANGLPIKITTNETECVINWGEGF